MTSCWQFYLGHYSSTGGKESKSMYTQINVLLMSPKGYISNCPPSCQKKPKCTLISKFVRACHYQFEAHSFKKKKKGEKPSRIPEHLPSNSHYQPGSGYFGKQNSSIQKISIVNGVVTNCVFYLKFKKCFHAQMKI